MPLNADVDLSDFWTLRIFLLKGLAITQRRFDSISQQLIQKFSSTPLSAVEQTILKSEDVKQGTIPELSTKTVASAFQQYSLRSSIIDLSFILNRNRTIITEEQKSLQPSRQVVGALCIESLSVDTRASGFDEDNGKVEEVTFPKKLEKASMRLHRSTDVFATTRNLKAMVEDIFHSWKVFLVIYVNSEEDSKASCIQDSSKLEESIGSIPPPRMLSPEAWLFDGPIDDSEWLTIPLHHFICNLSMFFLETIKTTTALVSSERENESKPSTEGPRSFVGKTKKLLGDLYLMMGHPLPALLHYHESTEIFRSTGDALWQAASLESEASALRLYDLKYLESDVASKLIGNVKRTVVPGTSFRPGGQTIVSDIQLPPEIEQLSRDAPRKWAFGLLGAVPTQDAGGGTQLGTDSSPGKSGQTKTVSNSLCRIDVVPGGQYNRGIPNRGLLIEMILHRLREALQLYLSTISSTGRNKSSLVFAAECSLRYARLLSFLGERLQCIDALSRLSDETKELDSPDLISVLLGSASIYESIGCCRHFAFYLLRAALTYLNSNNPKSAERLFTLCTPWYSLTSFQFYNWESSPPLSELTESPETNDTKLPFGFHESIEALRILAKDVGNQVLPDWNLSRNDSFQISDFPLDVYGRTDFPSSAKFFRKHYAKLMLYSKDVRYQHIRHLVWPTLHLFILESLRSASDRCQDYDLSIYSCFVQLVLLHPAMNATMQANAIRRINARASKLLFTASTPPALTIIPVAIAKPKQRSQPGMSRSGTTRRTSLPLTSGPLLKSSIVLGGVGRGFCSPIPNLLNLEILDGELTHRSTEPSTLCAEKQKDNRPFDSKYTSCHTIGFIRQRKSIEASPLRVSHQVSYSDESKLFLFSPWRQGTDVNRDSIGTVQYKPIWVVDELQTVRVTLENPLVIDLVIDELRIITAGGFIESQPVTVLLPPTEPSSSIKQVICDLNLIPKEPCELLLLGLGYTISQIKSSHYILKYSTHLQSYFSKSVNGGPDSLSYDEELEVLK